MPEIQSDIDKNSLNSGRTEEDTTSELSAEEPNPRCSNDDDAHYPSSRDLYVESELHDDGDLHEPPMHTSTAIRSSEGDPNTGFVVTETWDRDRTKVKTDTILIGQDLREIMYDVLGKQLAHNQNRDWLAQEQTVDDPMCKEIWYWNELSDAAKSNRGSEQGRQDLQLLLDHLSNMDPER